MLTLLALLLQAAQAAAPSAPSAATQAAAAPQPAPTIDQLVELKRVTSVTLSPDGTLVAYVVREANWDENAFETEIWLADAGSGETRRLTNAKKSSDAPAFSPDGKRLAFASDRAEKRQIYLIDPRGGEAEALTTAEDGVAAFAWSPDGSAIAFTAQDPKSDAAKEREKKGGEYEVVDQDHRMTHLHVIDVASRKPRRLTEGAFTVGRFDWSPDGTEIAFDHRSEPRRGRGRQRGHLDRQRSRREAAAARDPGGAGLEPRLLAGRIAGWRSRLRWRASASTTRTATSRWSRAKAAPR